MLNILVTGANGQLGSEIRDASKRYPNNYFFTDKESLDITNKDALDAFVKQNSIDVIINCAAYTAVDKAEDNWLSADNINRKAVKKLAKIAYKYSVKLIHISTDYVFDGKGYKPYNEGYQTKPKTVYGTTKREGELEMLSVNPHNSIILRTAWVYSAYGANFVKTMLKYGKERESLNVVYDQVGAPTYAADLADVILQIIPKIENNKVAIYHYSNEGAISWYDFAKEIMKMGKLECQINPIESHEYPTPTPRPHYSVLNKSKIKKDFGIEIPYWKDSLDKCLHKMGERK